jgi:hypothetical protein
MSRNFVANYRLSNDDVAKICFALGAILNHENMDEIISIFAKLNDPRECKFLSNLEKDNRNGI